MSYTVGNWTVASQTVDTISTPKTLSIPDLSYATDFSVQSRNKTEIRLANSTGAGLLTPEILRYVRQGEQDIYSSFNVPESQQINVRDGVVVTTEVRYLLKATNSVSGQEVILPMRGWINLKVPTADFITGQALTDLLMRTIASAFKTGATDGTLVKDLARGDLDPTA